MRAPLRRSLPALLLAALLLSACGEPPVRLRIATSALPNSASLQTAVLNEAFAAQGLEVELLLYDSGKEALQAVLDGHADLATTSETSLMHATIAGQPVRCWSILNQTRSGLQIVANRARGIERATDLPGKRIGLPVGTNAEIYLRKFLPYVDLPVESVQVVDLPPTQLAGALADGRIDAAVIWETRASVLRQQLGESAAVLHADAVYAWNWLLVGVADRAPPSEVLVRLLRAIHSGDQDLYKADPKNITALASWCGISPQELRTLLPQHHFRLHLNGNLVLSMEMQARALHGPLAAEAANFSQVIDAGPLRQIDPAAVTFTFKTP